MFFILYLRYNIKYVKKSNVVLFFYRNLLYGVCVFFLVNGNGLKDDFGVFGVNNNVD